MIIEDGRGDCVATSDNPVAIDAVNSLLDSKRGRGGLTIQEVECLLWHAFRLGQSFALDSARLQFQDELQKARSLW